MIDQLDTVLTSFAKVGIRNTTQILMLLEISRNEFASMAGLAKTAKVTTAASTGAVDAMERQGLVERRCGVDRRRWVVGFTDKGKQLMDEAGLLELEPA